MYKLDLKMQRKQRSNWQHLLDHRKGKAIPENIYFCFIDYARAFDCVDYNKLWKILKEMGIQDHLTYLLRSLYAGHEAIVRTRHGTMDWLKNVRSKLRLYVVILLIQILCREHCVKCWSG